MDKEGCVGAGYMIFLQSVLKFRGKSGCMEILDTLWEGAVSWGIARDVSAKYLEIF